MGSRKGPLHESAYRALYISAQYLSAFPSLKMGIFAGLAQSLSEFVHPYGQVWGLEVILLLRTMTLK